MIIHSKYKGYGQVNLKMTGKESDFIATIENDTDKPLKVFIDDLEGLYADPVAIPPHDWVGFLADDTGRFQVECIKNGDFKVIYEEQMEENNMKKYGNFLDLTDWDFAWFLKDIFWDMKEARNICRSTDAENGESPYIECTMVLKSVAPNGKTEDRVVPVRLTEDKIQYDGRYLSEDYCVLWMQYQIAKRCHPLFYKNPYLQSEEE